MPRSKPVSLSVRVSFKNDKMTEQLKALGKYLNDAYTCLDKVDALVQKGRAELQKIVSQANNVEKLFDLHIEQKKEEKKEDRVVE
ncbi:unnamed protein product [marine sediment metagenome]|uniref:Uncharacterized protein n=1 Tax=marine sediment metagenome TaxID=412755 RepID=X1JAJ4_9ZZZZ